jgi:drug/metabolite transporter (DMT)-like permease
MIGYFYLTMAVLGTSIGQLLLKKHNLQNNKLSSYLFFALLLLVSVPILTYLSLQYIDFIIVFLADALAISLIVFLSSMIIKDQINLKKLIGRFLIIVGIIMFNGVLNG